jgi:hypothetical protein
MVGLILKEYIMGVYGIMFFILLGVVALWVKGITNMYENHPDYKGEDFLNEEEDKEKK